MRGALSCHINGEECGRFFFNGSYPFTDLGSGGSQLGMIAAFDRVLALAGENTKNGPLGDRASLQRTRETLATLTQRIADQHRAGKSDEQIRAAKPTADYDAVWGQSFIGPAPFVQLILDGLPTCPRRR